MSSKETSLAELEKAVMIYVDGRQHEDHDLEMRRADAWRAAFEWHVALIDRHVALSEKVGAHIIDWIAIDHEEEEGMRLIREKLS